MIRIYLLMDVGFIIIRSKGVDYLYIYNIHSFFINVIKFSYIVGSCSSSRKIL